MALDLNDLKQQIVSWLASQPELPDGITIVVTVSSQDISVGEIASPKNDMLLKIFLSKDKFKEAGVIWHSYMGGVVYYIMEGYDSQTLVREFLEDYTERTLAREPCVGKKTVQNFQKVLVHFGFPPLRRN